MLPSMESELEEKDNLNIKDIIMNKKLIVHFQPIVSVSRKMVIGLEGLIRGKNTNTNEEISPIELFDAAHNEGVTLELDRVCREKVIEAFSYIHKNNNSKLLFLNVDASILERAAGSNYLINQIKDYNINPNNIVIEINETKVKDSVALKRFSETYRDFGFMIALDDVGTGFSNMDRILLIKPDIIKIDMSLIRNIHIDHYKQGVFKSLVNMSNKIGALVVAEGVETEEEATQILRLGGHMIQGYYFSKPQEIYDELNVFFKDKIEMLSKSFSNCMNNKINDERQKNKQLDMIISDSIKELINVSYQEFDDKLLKDIWTNKIIECAYILDENGIQISNTIRLNDKNMIRKSLIFYSAKMGTDLSMEKYYYPLITARLKKYITEPYISLATGNLCRTYSKIFTNVDNNKYILCIDFKVSDQTYPIELIKDINNSDLLININSKSNAEITKIISRMNEKINKDSLTNIYNRRYIEERLPIDIINAINENEPISVILADIDYFKEINDTYGHLAGDKVLKEFANISKQTIRNSTDWIARYGGDEFVIVLINANEKIVYKVAEKVRIAIEKAVMQYNDEHVRITASFGTYTLSSKTMTYEQLIDQADKHLYMAKKTGRNRIVSELL